MLSTFEYSEEHVCSNRVFYSKILLDKNAAKNQY